MSLLTVKDLTIRIEDQVVVEHLSFDLGASERLSILGPNGAGKTVLLKALLNLISFSGDVIWAPNANIGYGPQKIDADRHLPLTFNDLFAAKYKSLKLASPSSAEFAESVGLTKRMMATPVGHLSGGQF